MFINTKSPKEHTDLGDKYIITSNNTQWMTPFTFKL